VEVVSTFLDVIQQHGRLVPLIRSIEMTTTNLLRPSLLLIDHIIPMKAIPKPLLRRLLLVDDERPNLSMGPAPVDGTRVVLLLLPQLSRQRHYGDITVLRRSVNRPQVRLVKRT
jgi:hypothetical protein